MYITYLYTYIFVNLLQQALLNGQNVDIAGMMNTWLLQMGLPMVTVSRDTIHKDVAMVTQQHFLSDISQTPSDKYPSPYK